MDSALLVAGACRQLSQTTLATHRRTILAALAASSLALPALAADTPASPYAGQQGRSIKALSDEDIAALRKGEGRGMAKAAELNGYPGPAHVLMLVKQLAAYR